VFIVTLAQLMFLSALADSVISDSKIAVAMM